LQLQIFCINFRPNKELKMVRKSLLVALIALFVTACGKENVAPVTAPTPPAPAKKDPAPAPEPTPTDVLFEGRDKTKPCQITLHREWYEENIVDRAHYRAEVSTDYDEEGVNLGKLVVAFTEEGAGKVLLWENKVKKESLKIELKDAAEKLSSPVSFKLKQFNAEHGHSHSHTCVFTPGA